MTSSFPLLSLPFLAFEQIVKSMDLIEVFELSQVSRTTFDLLKSVRRKVHPIKIIKEGDEQIIEVSETDNNEVELSFAFEAVDQDVIRHIELRDCRLGVSDKEFGENTFVCYTNQFEQHFDDLVKYLAELFRNDTNAFYIDHTKVKEIENVIRNPIFKKCVALMVSTHTEQKEKMRNEDMELLLENKPVLEALLMNPELEEPEKLRRILDISRVFIRHAEWVKSDDLIGFKGEVCWLKFHSLEGNDITKYVNHWLQEKNSKIKQLHLDEFKERPLAEKVMEGVHYSERSKDGRQRFHRTKGTFSPPEVDCQNGLDIGNGHATVVFNPDSFKFVVWDN